MITLKGDFVGNSSLQIKLQKKISSFSNVRYKPFQKLFFQVLTSFSQNVFINLETTLHLFHCFRDLLARKDLLDLNRFNLGKGLLLLLNCNFNK